MENKKPQYASYNGLGREAMIGATGIPLMTGLGVTTFFLLLWIILQAFVGPISILVLFVAVPILLFLRVICGNDDKAMRILILELRCWMRHSDMPHFGKTLTLLPIKYGRHHARYQRFIKEVWHG